MLIVTHRCIVTPQDGFTATGQSQAGAEVPEMCAIVKIKSGVQHTTVRADQSASRGYADENTAAIVLLMTPQTKAVLDCRIDVIGISVRVLSSEPRFSPLGQLDHWEIGGEIWG